MMQRSSLFFALVLGIAFSIAPLKAQDNPPNPPQKEIPAADQMQPQAWAGDLIDATCKAATSDAKCEVSATTKAFGLQSADGNFYRFDDDSNAKVMEALKTTDKRTGAIQVAISGSVKEGTMTVATVEIRKQE